jgi:putative oxidoreductase
MTPTTSFSDTWTPRALAVLRIVTAFLFLQHGGAKILHVPNVAMFDALPVMSLVGVAGLLELVGGALLLVGLWTRPVAFIVCGEMAVAYFIGHASQGNVPGRSGGAVLLHLSVPGGGGRRRLEHRQFAPGQQRTLTHQQTA